MWLFSLRRFILVLVVLSICASQTQLYAQWSIELLTSGLSTNFNTISHFNSEVIVAGGAAGIVTRSTNAGNTWTSTTIQNGIEFLRSSFLQSGNGWIVGTNGCIKKTTDAGYSWTTQNSSTTSKLNTVFAVNDSIVFAAGENGVILKTINGGRTWVNVHSSSTTEIFRAMYFADKDFGVIAGGGVYSTGYIYITQDGGSNWYLVNETDQAVTTIEIVDHDRFYAAGVSGFLCTTFDGGKTWARQSSGTDHWLYSLHFINSQNGFVFGGNVDQGVILSTKNGATFSKLYVPNSQWLYGCTFPSDTTGYVAGFGGRIFRISKISTGRFLSVIKPNGGEIWKTGTIQQISWNTGISDSVKIEYSTNNGSSWIQIATVRPTPAYYNWPIPSTPSSQCKVRLSSVSDLTISDISDGVFTIAPPATTGWDISELSSGVTNQLNSVSHKDTNIIVTVGDSACILRSSNRGLTWTKINVDAQDNLMTIKLNSNGFGWAAGYNGLILRTTNSGVNWTNQTSPVNTRWNAIHMFSDSAAIIVGDDGKVIVTENGGALWQAKQFPDTANLRAVVFTDKSIGYICGGDFITSLEQTGLIFKTTDGGNSWNASFSFFRIFNTIALLNDRNVYAGGVRGWLALTSDGGGNWYLGQFSDYHWLYTMNVLSSTNIFVFGGDVNTGFGIFTEDGENWQPLIFNQSQWLYGSTFPASNLGFVVGYNGKIYRMYKGLLSSVDDAKTINEVSFRLAPNYPNPFNPSTNIEYTLPETMNIEVSVFDILGQKITDLFSGQQSAGLHTIKWDASKQVSGIYFCKIKAGKFTATTKMILMK